MTVYYIQAENGLIKIGYTSKNVNDRLSALQTASPFDLKIIATEYGEPSKEIERHNQFSKNNFRGEWFVPCQELNDLIIKLNSKAHIKKYQSIESLLMQNENLKDKIQKTQGKAERQKTFVFSSESPNIFNHLISIVASIFLIVLLIILRFDTGLYGDALIVLSFVLFLLSTSLYSFLFGIDFGLNNLKKNLEKITNEQHN